MVSARGFTITEVVVAVVVLGVGLVALAASSGLAARLMNLGELEARAAIAAGEHLDLLASVPCVQITAGAAQHGRLLVEWSVESALGGATRSVTILVHDPTGLRADTLVAQRLCP